jgi:hypothetical protein
LSEFREFIPVSPRDLDGFAPEQKVAYAALMRAVRDVLRTDHNKVQSAVALFSDPKSNFDLIAGTVLPDPDVVRSRVLGLIERRAGVPKDADRAALKRVIHALWAENQHLSRQIKVATRQRRTASQKLRHERARSSK